MRNTILSPWVLALLLTTTLAQTIAPSNASQDLYPVSTSPRFLLNGSEFPPNTPAIRLAPLGPYAEMSHSDFTATDVSGQVITITATNVNNDFSQNPRKFFYLSCDDSFYSSGNLHANEVFNLAANNNGAFLIILFSTSADHCAAAGLDNLPALASVMTTTEPMVAELLLNLDLGLTSPGLATLLPDLNAYTNDTDSGNRSWYGQNRGPNGSPTTAVAMIILYSITGVITALFVSIIITGAIRAHRHPERYGPRVAGIGGRGRQGRARGIARAVVDSLPIVKFGGDRDGNGGAGGAAAAGEGQDGEAQKTVSVSGHSANEGARDGDIEMTAGLPNPNSNTNTAGITNHETPAATTDTPAKAAATTTATAIAATPAAAATAADHPTTQPTEEEAPSCSICTEEFTIGADLRVLPCDHRFHPECVDPWLLNVSGTCPLCRIDLRPKDPDAAIGEDGASPNPEGGDTTLGDRQFAYPEAATLASQPSHPRRVSQAGGFRPGEDSILAFSLRSGRSRGVSHANATATTSATTRRPSTAGTAENAGALATLRRAMAGSREERVAALRRFREETAAGTAQTTGAEGIDGAVASAGQGTEEAEQRRGLARRLRERLRVRTVRRGEAQAQGEPTLGEIRSREFVDGRPV